MAISKNQLLLGGAIVALIAILYLRTKSKGESKLTLKDIDDSMPNGKEDIPMPEVEPTTGGVKPIPTKDTPVKVPTTGGVKPPPKTGGVKPPPRTGGVTPPPKIGGVTPPPRTGGVTPPPRTGGVKPIPTKDTPVKVPTTGSVTPPPPQVDECMQRWIKAEKLTFFATEEDRIKRRNAFLAQCSGMLLPVPSAPPRTTAQPLRPKGVGFMDTKGGTLDTFDVH